MNFYKLAFAALLVTFATAAPGAGQGTQRAHTRQRQQQQQAARPPAQQPAQPQRPAEIDWQRRGEEQHERIKAFFDSLMTWAWRLAAVVAAAGVAFLTYRFARGRRQDTSHGSAAWGKPADDLKRHEDEPLPPGSIFLAPTGKGHKKHYLAIPHELALRHTVIVGGSGTGKSRGYFMPTLALHDQSSAVVTDIKYELWQKTSGLQPRVCRLAPSDPDNSASFNFVALCKDKRMAELCAEAIVANDGESFWVDTETQLLTALFSHVAHTETPTPAAAYDLLTLTPTDELVEQLSRSPSVVARRQANLFASNAADPKTRANIMTGTVRALRWLEDDSVRRFTSSTLVPPDFALLKRKAVTIYWSLRESDVGRLKKLSSIFFTVLFAQLEEATGPVPVTVMLDEAGNIGTIPRFAATLTLARGRGLAVVLGLQSPSQLDAVYGRDNARTIFQTCATKIVLSGADLETAKYVSETLGDYTVATPTRTTSKAHHRGGSTTTITKSQHVHARRLMMPDEVRMISDDAAIVIMANRAPLLVEKIYYDRADSPVRMGKLGRVLTIKEPAPAERAPRRAPSRQPPQMPQGIA